MMSKPNTWVAFHLGVRAPAAVNRVDDCAGVFEADAIVGGVSAARPAHVHQPDGRVVLAQL
jgi:hypothetical protein